MQKPFIELYRPQSLDDVVGNVNTVQRLKYFIQNGNLPNLLFSSPPGMGKTTIAHCLGRQMLKEQFKTAFIELNASDERNVTDIRERVKTFAQLQITLDPGRHKLVFLDECDSMTSQAQLALRRIIEDFSDTTRFILCCNMIQKVVEPLQSRCCLITLQPPSVDDIQTRLVQICSQAQIKYTAESLKLLSQLAEGDVRNAVNNLQTTAYSLEMNLTLQGIKEVLDFIDVNQVGQVLTLAKENISDSQKKIKTLISEGFSVEEIINAFYRYGQNVENKMPDTERVRFLKAVAQAHARIAGGVQSEIQVMRMIIECVGK